MATRRLDLDEWSPVYQTRISTRSRNCERALRPKPLNIPLRPLQSPPELKAPPPSRKESLDYGDMLRDPEIVDVAPAGTWPRREVPTSRPQRKQSASITSQYSTRQSEISLGILDYYLRDRTPSLYSPELPPPTPKLDPAIEKFAFDLPPTPTPSATPPDPPPADTKPGAERRDQPLIPISPPLAPTRPPLPPKGYSLFPVIKQVTPPPRRPTLVDEPITLHAITPTTIHPAYRPRKESITSSSRPRTDSSARKRILSSDNSTPRQPSPPSASRWSDTTITTPPSTAGPRTSFGSLLRRESAAQQTYAYYPDSFFEDDDDDGETEPLRRRWRRSPVAGTSLKSPGRSSAFGRKEKAPLWRRVLLCGCGG